MFFSKAKNKNKPPKSKQNAPPVFEILDILFHSHQSVHPIGMCTLLPSLPPKPRADFCPICLSKHISKDILESLVISSSVCSFPPLICRHSLHLRSCYMHLLQGALELF